MEELRERDASREKQRLMTNRVQWMEGFCRSPEFPKESKDISKSDRASPTAIRTQLLHRFK